VFYDKGASLVSSDNQPRVPFIVACGAPLGDGSVVVEKQVAGCEPTQALALVELDEPRLIPEVGNIVPWGFIQKEVVTLGDNKSGLWWDGNCTGNRVSIATYPTPSKVSGAPFLCSSPRASSTD
jgi:hypothetical protein